MGRADAVAAGGRVRAPHHARVARRLPRRAARASFAHVGCALPRCQNPRTQSRLSCTALLPAAAAAAAAGFVFNSPWVVYCSFPLRRESDDQSLTDRALARSVQPWQWSEASRYNDVDLNSDSD